MVKRYVCICAYSVYVYLSIWLQKMASSKIELARPFVASSLSAIVDWLIIDSVVVSDDVGEHNGCRRCRRRLLLSASNKGQFHVNRSFMPLAIVRPVDGQLATHQWPIPRWFIHAEEATVTIWNRGILAEKKKTKNWASEKVHLCLTLNCIISNCKTVAVVASAIIISFRPYCSQLDYNAKTTSGKLSSAVRRWPSHTCILSVASLPRWGIRFASGQRCWFELQYPGCL